MWSEIKFALRRLKKNPAISIVAILSLAVGIGANTAIFSVINAVVFRSLPYHDPDRLVELLRVEKEGLDQFYSPRNFEDYTRQSGIFQNASAINYSYFNLTGKGEPEHVQGAEVTWNFFQVVGVNPVLGRSFRQEEGKQDQRNVAVLSNSLWRAKFGANAGVIGKPININGVPHTIIGIAPANFDYPKGTQLWRPLLFSAEELDPSQRGARWILVVGRLKNGASLKQAEKQMHAFASRMSANYPRTERMASATVMPLQRIMVKSVRPALLILFASVGLVLFIACANVTNILLAQSAKREGEVAVRTALGAGRWRLVRQFIVESIMLTIAAAAVGMMLAFWGRDLLIASAPSEIPRLAEVKIDYAVFLFAFLTALFTGVIVGIFPALHSSRTELNAVLKTASAGGFARGGRLRRGIVIGEVALAVVLLMAAGLLIKSFVQLQQVRPGFDPTNLVTFDISLPNRTYPGPHEVSQFMQKYLDELTSQPGVGSAAAVFGLPLADSFAAGSSFEIVGRPAPNPDEEPDGGLRVVTFDYFRTMRIPVLKGRAFERNDSEDSRPVAIINQAAARRYWPNENPIGRMIRVHVSVSGQKQMPRQIVGIVGDVHFSGLDAPPEPEVYLPHTQQGVDLMSIIVRSKIPAAAAGQIFGKKLRSLDAALPFWNLKTMEEVIGSSVAKRRFLMLLLTIFAGVALLLAALGIYGVLSFSVTQRTREIGLRMALGAEGNDLIRMVLKEAFIPVAVGLIGGSFASLSLSRIVTNQLFHVKPTDSVTFGSVMALLVLVALIASFLPVRKAIRVDPMLVLRYE